MAGGEFSPTRQNNRRRRILERDSSSKPSLSDLEDDLLTEILQRLPAAKDAFLCSSVCKRWYGIIFTPHFSSRFVTYHANHVDVARRNNSSGNLGRFESSISVVMMDPDVKHGAIILPQNPSSKLQTVNMKSLCEGSVSVGILSSCHDLLLCVATVKKPKTVGLTSVKWCFRFFICNPVTMRADFVSVPKWEEEYPFPEDSHFAFVCEPYCSEDLQGACILNAGFQYRVLCVRAEKLSEANYLPIEIYCSERREFSQDGFIEDSLCGEEFLKGIQGNVFVYKGKVHWFNGESIVAYDPFRIGVHVEEDAKADNGFIIKGPRCVRNNSYLGASYKLGVCCGHLRLMCSKFDNDLLAWSFRFWDLKDYDEGKWSAVRKFRFYGFFSYDHPLYRTLGDCLSDGSFSVVAPHPCDKDLVYMSFFDTAVTLCNLKKKDQNVIAEFEDRAYSQVHTEDENLGNPIVIPWWPTPIASRRQDTQH